MQKKETITIKDIAKALNLSIATVSRSLKDSYQISEKTKKLVKEFAAANHYSPNLNAQSLKSHKTRSIGLLLCSIPNTFFAEVIDGIEFAAKQKNYHLIITQSYESIEKEIQNLDFLNSRSVDGFLVSISTETQTFDHFTEVLELELPIVFFDRVAQIKNTHHVVSANADGSYQATKHLIEQGCRNIGHITSSQKLSITNERLEGYTKALTEAGIEINESYIKYCHHGGMLLSEVENAIDQLLSAEDGPIDALITASDRITVSSLSLLQKRGVKIPEQLALIGFTNFTVPEIFNPPLTTIRQSAFEMGKIAADLLITQIESKRPVTQFEKIVLPTILNIRESSCKKTTAVSR